MTTTTEIYSEIIIENIIKKYLQRGEIPTISQIEDEFDAIAATQDLTSSDFTSTEWKVERKEKASAAKFNSGFLEVQQDLNVLYKTLLENTEASNILYQKWQIKTNLLESRVKDLETRIGNLLLRIKETDGYFNTVGDKFTNTSKIDLNNSSGIAIDLKQNVVLLDRKTNKFNATDRIFLNDIDPNQVSFNVITRNKIVGSINLENTSPYQAFLDSDLYWKAKVTTSEKVINLIAELNIDFKEATTLSRIDLSLLSSDSNSGITITPMYSTDSINFLKLPSQITSITSSDSANFQFGSINPVKIKFILEKTAHDYKEQSQFSYEFGFKEIQFFTTSFTVTGTTKPTFYSIPLSITKEDGTLSKFNKLSLEVCDGVSSETKIDYYLSVGKNTSSGVSWLVSSGISTNEENRLWFPVSPLNRETLLFPDVIDIALISTQEIADISISYDFSGAENFVSPGALFDNISTVDSVVETESISSSDIRYEFLHENQKILNYQIDSSADIDLDNLVLWRNVGEKGLVLPDSTNLVRGNLKGWEYSKPYYSTYCLVKNPNGLSIDVGNKPITIDSNIVTGKILLTSGVHLVKIHQDNWNYVDPELTSIEELKAKDILYPFNQKLIIEGYQYSSTWKSEKAYSGTDRFAGYLCKQVSPFDLIQNSQVNDFSKFCLDNQIPNSNSAITSKVILVNTDMSRADFINESFLLEFKLTDELFSYVALKAEMSTTNTSLTPILDEYKIKIGL